MFLMLTNLRGGPPFFMLMIINQIEQVFQKCKRYYKKWQKSSTLFVYITLRGGPPLRTISLKQTVSKSELTKNREIVKFEEKLVFMRSV